MGFGDDKKSILEKYGPYVRSLAATVRKQFNAQLEIEELVVRRLKVTDELSVPLQVGWRNVNR